MSERKRKVYSAQFKEKVAWSFCYSVAVLDWYSREERPHQALGERVPAQIYATGSGGGTRISGVGCHPMEIGGHNGAANVSPRTDRGISKFL